MLGGRIHDHKTGQQSLQIEPHMRLSRRFAPSVLSPIHAVSNQFQNRAVNHVNGHLKAECQGPSFASPKSRRLLLEVLQRPPKKLFPHLGRTFPISVRKTIATGGRGPTNRRERARVQLQRITDVIEADAVGELSLAQSDHMTPRAEGPGLIFGSGLASYFGNLLLWNVIANLAQDVELGTCWFDFCFFHACLVAGSKSQANTFSFFCGMAVKKINSRISEEISEDLRKLDRQFFQKLVHVLGGSRKMTHFRIHDYGQNYLVSFEERLDAFVGAVEVPEGEFLDGEMES